MSSDDTADQAGTRRGWFVVVGLCASVAVVAVGAVWGVPALVPVAAVGLMPWLRDRGAPVWQPVGVWPVLAAGAAAGAVAVIGVSATTALWMASAGAGCAVTAHAAHRYSPGGQTEAPPVWISVVTALAAVALVVYLFAQDAAGPVAAAAAAAAVVVAIRAIRFGADPEARLPRAVAIGVCDTHQVIAMSVSGCEPVALGAVSDDPAMLYVAAANTVTLPLWAIRAGMVWDVGPRPRPSHLVPFDEFRELAAGEVKHTGETLMLMGDAMRRLEGSDTDDS